MRDYLLELAQYPKTQQLVEALGLNVQLPVRIRRATGAWQKRMLAGRVVAIGGVEQGQLAAVLGASLADAGVTAWVIGSERAAQAYHQSGQWLQPIVVLPPVPPSEERRVGALLFDATGIATSDGLRAVYEFFHTWLAHLEPCGRVLIVARPPEMGDLNEAAARGALDGFCRSVAKEFGHNGVTANLLYVEPGADARLGAAVRFLLSDHAAFITAQSLRISALVRANPQRGFERCLSGKVALITGAAGDIGRSTAEALAREGAQVVCLDKSEHVESMERWVAPLGGKVLAKDLLDTSTPAALVQYLRDAHQGVDIVVHNAGIARDKTLLHLKADAWDAVMRVNLSVVARLTEAFIKENVLRDDGRLIAVSAVTGITGGTGQANYAASKAGLIGLVQNLAPKLAPRGITANALAPGLIETQFVARIPAALRQFARRMSALAQGGQPEDVASAATFLATPAADGVSGRVIRVCGGAFSGA
jgi:3-oxoacyl-[acyl-carrier protein] reductase